MAAPRHPSFVPVSHQQLRNHPEPGVVLLVRRAGQDDALRIRLRHRPKRARDRNQLLIELRDEMLVRDRDLLLVPKIAHPVSRWGDDPLEQVHEVDRPRDQGVRQGLHRLAVASGQCMTEVCPCEVARLNGRDCAQGLSCQTSPRASSSHLDRRKRRAPRELSSDQSREAAANIAKSMMNEVAASASSTPLSISSNAAGVAASSGS